MLGSTIARKSTLSISDGSLANLQDGLIHTFSDVGGVEFLGEVQEVLHLVAKFQVGQLVARYLRRDDTTHFRQGYHTKPAAPLAAVKYLVDES